MDLQQALSEQQNVSVSVNTIWRTLRKLGFTHKKVRTFEYNEPLH